MGDILSVSNAQELRKALVDARGGETIELAGGDYGQLDLITFKTFGVKAIYDVPVTITSADPDDRASLSGMNLNEVKNLTFDNVVFASEHTGSTVWVRDFQINKSEGITIRDSLFKGKLAVAPGDPIADGFATGKGLTVGSSSNVVIENNEFTTWHRGLTVGSSNDVSVIGNDFHSMRSDGMNFAHSQGVLIENNHIHDFARSKESADHADMIQFWTSGGGRPSTDVVIRGNILDVGDGDTTQTIFMRNDMVDRGIAGDEMFYRNFLIEENVISNAHLHGITVGEADGLVIRNNTLIDSNPSNSSSVSTPQINMKADSRNVVIEQNAVAKINGAQPDWTVSDNILFQNADPNVPGHYETEFLASSMSGEVSGYIVDPNGTIAALDAGASRLRLQTSPDSLQAAFDVSNAPDATNSVIFDAGHTYGSTGNVTPSDAQFIWDFGDGTGATGQIVRHSYAEAGRYDATLTVVTPDGATATATSEIGINGADILSFDAETGFFQAEGYGEAKEINNSDRASVETDAGYGIDLGDNGTAVSMSQSHIARLFGAENFDMSMTLRADTLGSTGEITQVYGNFVISVVNRGEVDLRLWTDEGSTRLTTTRATVNDGDDHDIRVVFDSEASRLEIHVDGALAAATDVEGVMRTDYPRNLHFGNAWGKQNFDGTLTAFELAATGNEDYPDYAGDVAGIPSDAVAIDELPSIPPGAEDPAQNAASEGQDDRDPSADAAPTGDSPKAPVDESHDTPVPPDDSEAQAPSVIIDAEGDRLEVVIDDNVTPEVPDPDPVVISPVGYQRGGSISTAWTRHYDSDTNDPENAEVFVDDAVVMNF